MEFQPSFFEDEVRDGFYVSGKMKRFWAGQMEVLYQIDKVCKRHNLTYFGDYGTILGAVRHGGFIPWDDDLDICMKRDELYQFIKYARQELPKGYYVFDFESEPDFENLLIRVVSGRSITYEPEVLSSMQGCPYAVGVDIFPLDHVAPTQEENDKQVELIQFCLGLAQMLNENGEIPQAARAECRKIIKHFGMDIKQSLTTRQKLYIMAEKLMTLYNDVDTKYITNMGNYLNNSNHYFESRCFEQTITIPFEGFPLPVPACYDELLRNKYGDYMRPVKTGSAHDYPGFSKQDEAMREAVGGIWCGYNFDEACLKKGERAKATLSDAQKQQTEILQVLCSAQEMILAVLSGEHPEEVLPILEQCQNLALQLGNLLEAEARDVSSVTVTLNESSKAKESNVAEASGVTKTSSVAEVSNVAEASSTKNVSKALEYEKSLEIYCEKIYTLYQLLVGELEVEDDYEEMLLALLRDQNALLKGIEIKPRRKVLFLLSRARNWCFYEKLYRDEVATENTDVYIMPVPWYEKTLLGELGEMHSEDEEIKSIETLADLPQERFLVYNQTFLEALSPDVIYTQDPYENCTAGTSLHPYYYASRIWAYTRKLCYIPPFVVDEVDIADERSRKAMTYCCNVPGVLWADRVIVQSDSIRRVYIENLTEYAGEETRSYWEELVCADDGGIYDLARETDKRPVTGYAFPEAGDKKCLCFHVGSAVLLQKGMKAIEKLQSVLDAFEQATDHLYVFWWEESGVLENLRGELGSAELAAAFEEVLKRFTKLRLGEYHTVTSRENIVKSCDAYYGDGSYIMNLFVRHKKPVMQMDL